MRRPRSPRRATRTSTDPIQAFRHRADRDRREIERALAQLDATVGGPPIAELLAEIEDVAHGLAGAGGVFGFSAVSKAALKVERQLERWRLDLQRQLTSNKRAALSRSIGSLVAALRALDSSS